MKTIYLDCGMGAAGDMLTAALLELHPDPAGFVKKLNALGLPGVQTNALAACSCGVGGTHMQVLVNGQQEGCEEHHHTHHHHEHDHHDHCHEHHGHSHEEGLCHEHHHEEEHHHSHMSIPHITELVAGLPVSDKVHQDILEVYGLIAQAESKVHGVPVEQVHLHEVGALDAMADVAAVCLLMEELAPEQVLAGTIHVGFGQVKCAHGVLPVPAPATALILQGMPICAGSIEGELCTPTGAALLKHFVTGFGPMPAMTVEKIGYGIGSKQFPAANCVRAMLGQTQDGGTDEVVQLSCELDDMTPEELAFAQERLLREGVLDVFTLPVGMKKNRPGTLLVCLCRPQHEKETAELILRHTSTLGVRRQVCQRYTLERQVQTIQTPYGPARRKWSQGYGVQKAKWEYEDLVRISGEQGCTLAQARSLLDAFLRQDPAQ